MIDRLRVAIERVAEFGMGFALTALVVLEASLVVLRYGFATGVAWAGEVSVLLLMSIAWLGLPLLWLRGGHIAVDMLGARGVGWHRRLPILLDLVMVPICAVLIWATARAIEAFGFMDMAVLPVSQAIKLWPVMIGALGLALVLVVRIAERRGRA
jgi:TRAP-type C4-dicarboxylate transport system permease small subunit